MTAYIHQDTKIGQVQLKVSDLERSVHFYREIVGLKVLNVGSGRTELTADGVHPIVVLHQVEHAQITKRRSAAGLYHFAILLPNRKALGLSLRHLLGSGIHIGQSDHWVSEALYITDPDNNGIEIYADRSRELWQRDDKGSYMMAVDPLDRDSLLAEAGDEQWSGLPLEAIIGHIHLHVAGLEESFHFYCELLGFELMAKMDESALFVAAGGYHHHIGLNIWAGIGVKPTAADATGLLFYSIILPNQQALDAVHHRLLGAGIAAQEAEHGFLVVDPAGIELHIMQDEYRLAQ